jgi:MFS family permease
MAVNRLAVNLGFAVGPAVGGFLATMDYELLFIVDAATSLLAAVLLIAFFARSTSPDDDDEEVGEGAVQRSPWRDGVFLCAMALVFVMALVFLQIFSTYPLYLRTYYRISEVDFGLIFTMNTGLIVAFEMILVRRIERFNPLVVMGIGALLIGLGIGAIMFGRIYAFCLLTVGIWTLGEMINFPMAAAFVTSRSGATARGTFMGIYTMAFSLANATGPAVGAWLYEVSPDLLWMVCLVAGVVTSGGFFVLARVEKQRQPPSDPLTQYDEET